MKRNTHQQYAELVVAPFANQSAWGVYRVVPGGPHGTRLVFVTQRASKAAAVAAAKRFERARRGRARTTVAGNPRKRSKRQRRNPTLALVGANPRGGQLLGKVTEVRYVRETGAQRGRYKHAFKTRANLLAMPNGSLAIIGG